MRIQSAIAALTLFGFGCAPTTILSAKTVKDEPARVYPQLAAALSPHYQCKEGTDDISFAAHCKSERGGISVEIKKKTERPVLALHFWIANDKCGSPELALRLEQFVLRDATGGTRAYCQDDKLVLAFESYLPAAGVEPAELGTFVASWEKNASLAAERFGLFPDGDKKS